MREHHCVHQPKPIGNPPASMCLSELLDHLVAALFLLLLLTTLTEAAIILLQHFQLSLSQSAPLKRRLQLCLQVCTSEVQLKKKCRSWLYDKYMVHSYDRPRGGCAHPDDREEAPAIMLEAKSSPPRNEALAPNRCRK